MIIIIQIWIGLTRFRKVNLCVSFLGQFLVKLKQREIFELIFIADIKSTRNNRAESKPRIEMAKMTINGPGIV